MSDATLNTTSPLVDVWKPAQMMTSMMKTSVQKENTTAHPAERITPLVKTHVSVPTCMTCRSSPTTSLELKVKVSVPQNHEQMTQKPVKEQKSIWRRIIRPPVKARAIVTTTTKALTTTPTKEHRTAWKRIIGPPVKAHATVATTTKAPTAAPTTPTEQKSKTTVETIPVKARTTAATTTKAPNSAPTEENETTWKRIIRPPVGARATVATTTEAPTTPTPTAAQKPKTTAKTVLVKARSTATIATEAPITAPTSTTAPNPKTTADIVSMKARAKSATTIAPTSTSALKSKPTSKVIPMKARAAAVRTTEVPTAAPSSTTAPKPKTTAKTVLMKAHATATPTAPTSTSAPKPKTTFKVVPLKAYSTAATTTGAPTIVPTSTPTPKLEITAEAVPAEAHATAATTTDVPITASTSTTAPTPKTTVKTVPMKARAIAATTTEAPIVSPILKTPPKPKTTAESVQSTVATRAVKTVRSRANTVSYRDFKKNQKSRLTKNLRDIRPIATTQAKIRRKLVLITLREAVPIFCLLILLLLVLFFGVGFSFFVIPVPDEGGITKTTPCECVTKPTTTIPIPVNNMTAHLFNAASPMPSALFWDEIFQTLYFVDPTQSRIYWWKPKYGKDKCPYAEVQLTKDKNIKDGDNKSKYKLMFAYPFKESAKTFIAGLGPIIVVVTVDTLLEEKEAKASYLAEICEKGQTITVAKPSPFGSLFIACRDDPITENSIARIYKYYNRTKKLLVDHYTVLWSIFGSFTHKYITGIAFSSKNYVDPYSKWPFVFFIDSDNGIVTVWPHNPQTDEIDPDGGYERFRTFTISKPWDVTMDGGQYLWLTMVNKKEVVKFHTKREHEWDEHWYAVPGLHTYGIVQGLKNQKTFIVSTEANDELKRLTNKTVSGVFYLLNGHYKHRYKPGSIYYIEFRGILNRNKSEFLD